MKSLFLCLAALATTVIFNGAALGAGQSANGKVVAQITGGGYLQNGYKCGIAVVKKELRDGAPVLEGTLHCMSVVAKAKNGDPLKLLVDCDAVDVRPNCTVSSFHGVPSAVILCRGGKEIDVTAAVPGSPFDNGTISAKGWGTSDFPPTPVLHGTINVECK